MSSGKERLQYLGFPILVILAFLIAFVVNGLLAHFGLNPLGLSDLSW